MLKESKQDKAAQYIHVHNKTNMKHQDSGCGIPLQLGAVRKFRNFSRNETISLLGGWVVRSFVTKKFERRKTADGVSVLTNARRTHGAQCTARMCTMTRVRKSRHRNDGHVDSSVDATIDLAGCILELSGTESKEQNLRTMIQREKHCQHDEVRAMATG